MTPSLPTVEELERVYDDAYEREFDSRYSIVDPNAQRAAILAVAEFVAKKVEQKWRSSENDRPAVEELARIAFDAMKGLVQQDDGVGVDGDFDSLDAVHKRHWLVMVQAVAKAVEPRWIPCEERLPESGKQFYCLISTKRDNGATLEYYTLWNRGYFSGWKGCMDLVQAWLGPLPPPPQKETE